MALEALLYPKTVAVIGASDHPGRLGHNIFRSLEGARARVYPVNRRVDTIDGVPAYGSIAEVPERIDCAVIAIPASATPAVARECAQHGVGVIIPIASGFSEAGPEGASLERELCDALAGSKTRLLGPNTLGVVVPRDGLDTLFLARERSPRPGPGSVALISQSGSVSVALLERFAQEGLGISACVGLGNRADIDELELLDAFRTDGHTNVIALYLETFKDGRALLDTTQRLSVSKPLVVLKGGLTARGSVAASSHTGRLAAGSPDVVRRALWQGGWVIASDEVELTDFAKVLSLAPPLQRGRIAVVSSGGGYGVLATDLIEGDFGDRLSMATPSEEVQAKIEELTNGLAATGNPIDLTGSSQDSWYAECLTWLQAEKAVDGIIAFVQFEPPGITPAIFDVIASRIREGSKPVVLGVLAGAKTEEAVREFARRGVAAYPTIRRAIASLAALQDRARLLARLGSESMPAFAQPARSHQPSVNPAGPHR